MNLVPSKCVRILVPQHSVHTEWQWTNIANLEGKGVPSWRRYLLALCILLPLTRSQKMTHIICRRRKLTT